MGTYGNHLTLSKQREQSRRVIVHLRKALPSTGPGRPDSRGSEHGAGFLTVCHSPERRRGQVSSAILPAVTRLRTAEWLDSAWPARPGRSGSARAGAGGRAGSEAGAAALTCRTGRQAGRSGRRNFCHSTVVRPGPGLCSVTREAWARGRRRRFLRTEAGGSAADRRRRTSRSGRGAGDERRAAERAAAGGGRGR